MSIGHRPVYEKKSLRKILAHQSLLGPPEVTALEPTRIPLLHSASRVPPRGGGTRPKSVSVSCFRPPSLVPSRPEMREPPQVAAAPAL